MPLQQFTTSLAKISHISLTNKVYAPRLVMDIGDQKDFDRYALKDDENLGFSVLFLRQIPLGSWRI